VVDGSFESYGNFLRNKLALNGPTVLYDLGL